MEYLREGNGGWTTENRSLYGQVHEITKETLPADSTYIPQIFLFSVKCSCIGLLGFWIGSHFQNSIWTTVIPKYVACMRKANSTMLKIGIWHCIVFNRSCFSVHMTKNGSLSWWNFAGRWNEFLRATERISSLCRCVEVSLHSKLILFLVNNKLLKRFSLATAGKWQQHF